MMILHGALLCLSDTKIDQAGKSEETSVMVEESRMIMAVNSSFAGSTNTKEVDQTDEVKNNNKESSISAHTQSGDDAIDQIHQ